jgi:WD40 repeat protein
VQLWDILTGSQLKVFGGRVPVYSVTFSNDDSQIVSGSGDSTVRVWDVLTGEEIKRFEGHTGAVTSVALYSDGRRIASASKDGTVRIWGEPTTCRFHREYTVGRDTIRTYTGWLLLPSREGYLAYIPLEAELPDESNLLTIPSSAAPSINFTRSKLGTAWQECYKP